MDRSERAARVLQDAKCWLGPVINRQDPQTKLILALSQELEIALDYIRQLELVREEPF
jgi:hypothetical protein